MKLKNFIFITGIFCCSQAITAFAADQAVKEYTVPPAAESVPTPDTIPSLTEEPAKIAPAKPLQAAPTTIPTETPPQAPAAT